MNRTKVAQKFSGILALLLWFSAFALYFHYDGQNPAQPDPATGAIYPFSNHGHVTYWTGSERRNFYGLMALAGVAFLVSGVLYLDLRSRRRRE